MEITHTTPAATTVTPISTFAYTLSQWLVKYKWALTIVLFMFSRWAKGPWSYYIHLQHEVWCSLVRWPSKMYNYWVHKPMPFQIWFRHLWKLFAIDLFLDTCTNTVLTNFKLSEEICHFLDVKIVKISVAGNGNSDCKTKSQCLREQLNYSAITLFRTVIRFKDTTVFTFYKINPS